MSIILLSLLDMFSHYTTSKIIAIKFTLYVTWLLCFFGIIANIGFFRQWYSGESKRLGIKIEKQIWVIDAVTWRQWPKEKFMRTMAESLPYSTDLESILERNTIFGHLSKIDDEYVLYHRDGSLFNLVVVTRPVEAQRNILIINLLIVILWWFLTYMLSNYFVKSSLDRLYRLKDAVEKIDIDTLHAKIPLEWPDNDEIRTIWSKLQESLDKLQQQTGALKDFVSNAWHELKTPLMQIGWQVDYLIKSKWDYTEWLQSIKKTTKTMNHFIEELLTLAKLESQNRSIEADVIDLSPLITWSISVHEKAYADKKISVTFVSDATSNQKILPHHFHIIINNLLDNAYKYSNQWNITITIKDNNLIIQDTGTWIDAVHLSKIRDKFWQVDSSKTDRSSYGLWLSLVKKTADMYGWTIGVTSTAWVWTTFTLSMKQ